MLIFLTSDWNNKSVLFIYNIYGIIYNDSNTVNKAYLLPLVSVEWLIAIHTQDKAALALRPVLQWHYFLHSETKWFSPLPLQTALMSLSQSPFWFSMASFVLRPPPDMHGSPLWTDNNAVQLILRAPPRAGGERHANTRLLHTTSAALKQGWRTHYYCHHHIITITICSRRNGPRLTSVCEIYVSGIAIDI